MAYGLIRFVGKRWNTLANKISGSFERPVKLLSRSTASSRPAASDRGAQGDL